jgi:uncharacterized protein YegL
MSALEDSVEFITNQNPRCPCMLILDTSSSMKGARIEALNAGLVTLRDELLNDRLASKRIELAVVEFNSSARVVQDFVTAENFEPPALTASGLTNMAGGINEALDLIQQRKSAYRSNGVPYYRPWAFLITDGAPTCDMGDVSRRVHEEDRDKRIAFFAVGVEGADFECLKNISAREPKKLDGLKFRELFVWLSGSMRRVSQSRVGEMVPLEKGTWEAV